MEEAYLCTLDAAKIQGGLPPAQPDNSEDILWLAAIRQMSIWASLYCGCSFEPVRLNLTRVPTINNTSQDGRLLYLRARLLEAHAIALSDGTALSQSQYSLQPAGGEIPYSRILLAAESGLRWWQQDDPYRPITISGLWGQRSFYATSWASAASLTDAAAMHSTTLAVDSSVGLHIGALIRIGVEFLRIEAITGLSLRVRRAINGTPPTNHPAGSGLAIYSPDPMVASATARGAAWLKKRLGSFEQVKWSQESGLMQVIANELPDDITRQLAPYRSINALAESEFSTP